MTYFQMDDGFETEARVMRAGRPAFGLYSACGIWVARHLTDGFIPAEIAALYGTREWIEKLCTTGLWIVVDGGFDMPDYLGIHGNPTAETVRKRRADAALRKQRQRDKTRKHPNTSRGESRVTGGVTHGGSPASHSSPSLKGEGEAPPLRGAAPPPPAPTVTLTSGRVVCATHQLEVTDGGTCRGCNADAAANDDLDLDQRPPAPNLVAVDALDPHGDGTTVATPADAAAEYGAAQRDLAASGDAAWWRTEARRVLADRGHISPKRELVTVTAAELYRRSAENS